MNRLLLTTGMQISAASSANRLGMLNWPNLET